METPLNLAAQDELNLARQAAQWVEVLKTAGDAERAAFAKWVKASPANMHEFLMMTALERELGGIDAGKQTDIAAILAQGDANVVRLRGQPPLGGRMKVKRRWANLAAALFIVFGAGYWLTTVLNGVETYATKIGEQRAIGLEDGSIVHVNTQSQIKVSFSPALREVQLVDGEALFKVARDVGRPFKVRVGGNTIQALGTQFDVHRRSDRIDVVVLEGLVQISSAASGQTPTKLAAGKQARIERDGTITVPAMTDLSRAAAWRQRRLAFRGDTLADIADEFNRYNRSPRLQVEGDALRTLEFTANFDADDPQSLIDFLGNYDTIVCERSGDTVVIHQRAKP